MTTVTHAERPVAEARQTKVGLYVTAKEAYDMWQADPEGVQILDVRTPEEWVFTGHSPMAVNSIRITAMIGTGLIATPIA